MRLKPFSQFSRGKLRTPCRNLQAQPYSHGHRTIQHITRSPYQGSHSISHLSSSYCVLQFYQYFSPEIPPRPSRILPHLLATKSNSNVYNCSYGVYGSSMIPPLIIGFAGSFYLPALNPSTNRQLASEIKATDSPGTRLPFISCTLSYSINTGSS